MLAAALDWWREAGVDCAFLDEPQGWLTRRSDLAGGEAQTEASLSPAGEATAVVST